MLRSAVVTAAAALNDAKTAASDNASRVEAAFAEAGLSQDAISHILRKYPYYLRWPVEQKLLPAMQRWQQELGASFLSEFERLPDMLRNTPEKELAKNQYLESIGVTSPATLRHKDASAARQSLVSMQRNVASLQAQGFSQAQVVSVVERHPAILYRPSEHVAELVRVIGEIFGCTQDMDMVADVMASCRLMGWSGQSPAALPYKFSYFCTCVGVNDKEKRKAWKHGVFTVAPAELDIRLSSIAAQLGATTDQAKSVLRRNPEITLFSPATLGMYVAKMHDLGFSPSQVKSMCLRQPTLLYKSYSSRLQAEKWVFLTGVLQLSLDAIAAKPHLLMYSLPKRLGPRWEYLQQLRLHGVIAFTGVHNVISSLADYTDTQFRARYTAPVMRVYDEQFQQQWQQRWDFLLDGQQLSVQDIAAHPLVLQASLKDTLGPRWAFLLLITSSLDSFRPVDHLTALSTMNDAEFASAYSGMSKGVAFDVAFIHDWQQANIFV